MSEWYLYLLRTRDGDLYTGIATDVPRRIAEHAGGGARGAKFLRARGPLELVYEVRLGSRSVALRAEYRLKKLPKSQKQSIVEEIPDRGQLLSLLSMDPDPT